MSTQYGPVGDSTDRPDVEGRSVGEIVSQITSGLSTLMRQELELAKAELRQEAAKTGKAAGMFGGAGLAGWMVALFASLALMWALGALMPLGWAALIVAVLWAIVGAVLFIQGRNKMRQVRPVPEQTVHTLKEDVQWAKNRATSARR